MNLRFSHARFDLRRRGDDVVHVRGITSIVLCQPNLVGAPIAETDDPVTCLECSAIRDHARAVTRTAREDATHAARLLPLFGRAGRTQCGRSFAWALRQDGDEVNQMHRTYQEIDCMACIATEIANAQ